MEVETDLDLHRNLMRTVVLVQQIVTKRGVKHLHALGSDLLS